MYNNLQFDTKSVFVDEVQQEEQEFRSEHFVCQSEGGHCESLRRSAMSRRACRLRNDIAETRAN